MTDIIRRCRYCYKCYFIFENEEKCPFCGKKEKEFNPFKELFGDDNPSNNMGGT